MFAAEGQWLGEFLLKPRTRILEVGEHTLLTVRTNDDDVPLVEVWRFSRDRVDR